MWEKSTDDLDEMLENTSPDQLNNYLKKNSKDLADDKKEFYYYFKNVLDEKNIKLKDVYSFAGLSYSHGSKLVSMEKHTKNRDDILRLCIAGHFNLTEINRALKLYGFNELYSRNSRDACIIVAVNQRIYDLGRIDDILDEQGLEILSKPLKETEKE